MDQIYMQHIESIRKVGTVQRRWITKCFGWMHVLPFLHGINAYLSALNKIVYEEAEV